VSLIKKFQWENWRFIRDTQESETQEMTADDSMLNQFSTKTTMVLYAGQVKEKEALTYKVKVMLRRCDTS
jgi:hypothetical protein